MGLLRLSSLVHLYRVRVRRRAVQELLAVIGIAAGVALVFTALVANQSLVGSMEQLTTGVIGHARYQLSGRGGQPFDASLVAKAQRVPGVRVAAPVLDIRALLTGTQARRPVTLLGVDARVLRLGGSLLHRFRAVRIGTLRSIVLLPQPLARQVGVTTGAKVTVQTGAHTAHGVFALPMPEDELGGLAHSSAVVAPLPYAQTLSGLTGQVTRILVLPAPGHDREVAAGLKRIAGPGLAVRPADAEVSVFKQAAVPISQSTALFSVFAMLVGFLFALSAVLLTVPQRQRFIADLRIAGYRPAAVVQVMVFDALVLGAAGSLAGLLAGDLLSSGALHAVPGYLSFAFPIGGERIVTWSSVALAAASGLVAACVAVLAPLHDIFAVRPSTYRPRGRRGHHPLLAVGGLFALVAAGAVALLWPSAAILGLVLLTAALLLLLPLLVRTAVEAVDRVGHHVKSPVPALAVMELRSTRSRARSFALAATAAIAVFASVSISDSEGNLERGLYIAQHQLDRNADVWITFPGAPNTFATTALRLPPAVVARVAQVPGVASVRPYRGGFLDVGNRRVWVLAPPAGAPLPVPPGQVTSGDAGLAARRVRAGGAVVLSQGVAQALGVGVGDRIRLPSPVPTTLRVAALTTNLGWPPGTAVMSAADYARAWGDPAPTALLVGLAPGAQAAAVAARVRRATAASASLTVETEAQRETRQHAATRQGLERTTQISTIVLWTAILALVTAMGGVIWQRRPALARLKVDGFTELQLWKGLLLECSVLLGAGCVAGALLALEGQSMLTRGLIAITDFPVDSSPGAGLAAERVAIVLTLALAMLAAPGWMAVRVRPAAGSYD